MPLQNLEPLCARWGRSMIMEPDQVGQTSITDQENTITKALSVLAENGLYAMGVFLVSCSKKTYGDQVLTRHLAGLWRECGLLEQKKYEKAGMLTAISTIAEDLPTLILARKVAEQAMVFARYHAKAEVTVAGGRS